MERRDHKLAIRILKWTELEIGREREREKEQRTTIIVLPRVSKVFQDDTRKNFALKALGGGQRGREWKSRRRLTGLPRNGVIIKRNSGGGNLRFETTFLGC